MRSFRPSGKATLVAGALAVTLVVGATSGAVAGKLITSQDIKDRTIQSQDLKAGSVTGKNLARGSVTWEKALSEAAKAQIEALAGEDGAAGPQGPAGPSGPRGSTGATGAPGDGSLVAWRAYGEDWSVAPPPPPEEGDEGEDYVPVGQVAPLSGGDITLTEPGVYMVTVNALFSNSLGSAAAVAVGGSGAAGIGDFTTPQSCFSFIVPACNTTFPVFVGGTPVPLPVYALAAATCGCEDPAPPVVEVSVVKMGGTAPDTTDFDEALGNLVCDDDCMEPDLRALRKLVKNLS